MYNSPPEMKSLKLIYLFYYYLFAFVVYLLILFGLCLFTINPDSVLMSSFEINTCWFTLVI
jgi:hypothetical protein